MLLTPWFQTSGLQNCDTISWSCSDALFQQPWQALVDIFSFTLRNFASPLKWHSNFKPRKNHEAEASLYTLPIHSKSLTSCTSNIPRFPAIMEVIFTRETTCYLSQPTLIAEGEHSLPHMGSHWLSGCNKPAIHCNFSVWSSREIGCILWDGNGPFTLATASTFNLKMFSTTQNKSLFFLLTYEINCSF